jgi:hypothetical protein
MAFLAAAVAFLVLRLAQRDGNGDDLLGQARQRVDRLQAAVEEQRTISERAVTEYKPRGPGRLDDLTTSADALLRQLHGVVQVDTSVSVARPSARIVQLRDWHHVPRDLYALDARQVYGRDLTEEEIDALHEEHLLQVELVQLQQVALLRCLAKHHGLRRLLVEGMTEQDVPHYPGRIDALREAGKQLPALNKQLAEVRGLLKDMADREGPERYGKAQAFERELLDLLGEYRQDVLRVGAAGRLLVAKEIEAVLPLDDAELLDAARPVTPQGEVRADPVRVKARQDAQVLIHRPQEALRYCQEVRRRVSCNDLPDELILRALSGRRKHVAD